MFSIWFVLCLHHGFIVTFKFNPCGCENELQTQIYNIGVDLSASDLTENPLGQP